MSSAIQALGISQLSREERIEFVSEIWDSTEGTLGTGSKPLPDLISRKEFEQKRTKATKNFGLEPLFPSLPFVQLRGEIGKLFWTMFLSTHTGGYSLAQSRLPTETGDFRFG